MRRWLVAEVLSSRLRKKQNALALVWGRDCRDNIPLKHRHYTDRSASREHRLVGVIRIVCAAVVAVSSGRRVVLGLWSVPEGVEPKTGVHLAQESADRQDSSESNNHRYVGNTRNQYSTKSPETISVVRPRPKRGKRTS